MSDGVAIPATVDETLTLLSGGDYVADRNLATSLFVAFRLNRPLFLEGEAGVGKTALAGVLAERLGRSLLRSSATKASTSRPPSTNGTTRGR